MIVWVHLLVSLLLTIRDDASSQSVDDVSPNQHDDLTVNLKDPWGYEAIKLIHSKIDSDQDGSIDRKESLKFIVGDLKIDEGNDAEKREKTLHAGDGSISVDEMWEAWRKSQVSKWSVDEAVFWLINHVKLPQYSINFIENHIDGSRLPRIAANPSFVIHILKITDPLDRQRLTLSSIEAVLFGVPSNRLLPDRYLISVLIAISFILWIVLNQRRNVQRRLDKVFRQMTTLQESRDKLLSIQKELEKTKEGKQRVLDETENLKLKSQSSSNSVQQRESLKEKESALVKEIALTRMRLVQAEQMLMQTPVERIQQQKVQLQRWLQITFEIENKNYNEQKTQLEAELIKLKNQLGGKRKKSIRRLSGNNYYEELKATRLKLTGLINQIEICRDKWIKIEGNCGFSIRDNPGLPALQQMKPSLSFSRMPSTIDESETSEREDTPSPVLDGEFFPELHMMYRPSSRTSDYSTIKRNNSSKQLMRMMSNDETNEHINRHPLRNSKSTFIDKSPQIESMKSNEHPLLSKSLSSTPARRPLIRRSSSLQDILLRLPPQSPFNQTDDAPAEI